MTLDVAEFVRRLEAHIACALKQDGKAVIKGSAYYGEDVMLHWRTIERLARESGCACTLVDGTYGASVRIRKVIE